MKKLNKKGFTLIELLAVIVVLAIILVITIPTVIGSMNNAKESSLQNSADSVATWVEKQYGLYTIDDASISSTFKDNFITNGIGTPVYKIITFTEDSVSKTCTGQSDGSTCENITLPTSGTGDAQKIDGVAITILKAAGLNVAAADLKAAVIGIDESGKACVKLTSTKTGGKFSIGTEKEKSSAGCPSS